MKGFKEDCIENSNLKIQCEEALKVNCDSCISQSLFNLLENSKCTEKTILDQKIYKKLRDASDELHNNIINDCKKRLKAIKHTTSEALVVLGSIRKSIDSLFISGHLVFEDIKKLKDYSKQASNHYFTVCGIFNSKIDKIIRKYKPLPEKTKNISKFLNIVDKDTCKIDSDWEIEANDKKYSLPIWICKQINKGVKLGNTQINIFKGTRIVSIADVKKMNYYGILKNSRMAAQKLMKKI